MSTGSAETGVQNGPDLGVKAALKLRHLSESAELMILAATNALFPAIRPHTAFQDVHSHEVPPGVCFLRLAILNPSGVGLNVASSPSGGSW